MSNSASATPPFLPSDARIFVAGHNGMVGSALVRALSRCGYDNLLLRSSRELDLRDQAAVNAFFAEHRPEHVLLAAARVGGIMANSTRKAEFIYDNLAIQTNVIHAAWQHRVTRLLFLGSSCIYPRLAPQPLKEEYLLTGPLEPTNDAYAVAKIAGVTMCRAYNRQYGTRYLALMPTNLYGPNDNYDPTGSHVLPALLRRLHEAKLRQAPSVEVWGSGTPLREFLHVDDLAEACLFLLNLDEARYSALLDDPQAPALLNVGSGQEISIRALAELIRQTVGFSGELRFDTGKPDGTPRKLTDSTRLRALGWQPAIPLDRGVANAYQWFTTAQGDKP